MSTAYRDPSVKLSWSLTPALLACACATAPAPTSATPPSTPPTAVEVQAEAPSTPPTATWQEKVDELCARWTKPGSPGCVVGVIRDGELVLARGYGLANIEHDIPITPDTVFDLGSTSKQFTAACIGLLQQDGVLSVVDDVRRWVPEIPDYGTPITLDHLLHHTSGLRDYLELFMFAGRKSEDYTTSAQALAMIARQKALNFEPGAEHLYSNSGYFVLAVVVERASGKSLAKFAKERIFDPLGMKDTHVHDDHTLLVPKRATGYQRRPDGSFGLDMSDYEQTGDGAVMTTVRDLALWDANFETKKVGGEALQTFLHTRGRLADGTEIDYCRGLVVDTVRGLKRVNHGGAWAGYRAQLMRFPEQRTSILCMANTGLCNPSEICMRTAAILLGDRMGPAPERKPPEPRPATDASAPTLTPADLSALTGIYESSELEVRYEIVVRDGKLFTGEPGICDFEIPPISPNRFGANGATFEFTRDDWNAITGFKAGSGRMRDVWFARVR